MGVSVPERLHDRLPRLGRAAVEGAQVRVPLHPLAAQALEVRTDDLAEEESGRGLALLDALTLRWGVDQGPGAKTVWCELPEGDAP